MNVVELLAKNPFVFCVVDFEAAVLGDAVGWALVWNRVGKEDELFGLDGTQVCSDNTC